MYTTEPSPTPRGWIPAQPSSNDTPPESSAEPAAPDEPVGPEPPADDPPHQTPEVPPRDGKAAAAPAAEGGGSPPDAAPEDSPLHRPADGPPPRSGEDLGDDDDGPDPTPENCLQAWLAENWDAIHALEAAGRLGEIAVPDPEAAGETPEPEPERRR